MTYNESYNELKNLIEFYKFSNKELRKTVVKQNEKIKQLEINK